MNPHIDPNAATTLRELRHLTVRIGEVERAIRLHPPGYSSVVPGLMEPMGRDPRERTLIAGELVQVVDVDGEPVLVETADPILDTPDALAAILAARERMYAWLLELGRVVASCPTCGATKELDLAFYGSRLALPPRRVTDRSFIAAPKIASPAPPRPLLTRPYEERLVWRRKIAARPDSLPRAGRIDFVLPSARAGLAGPGDAVTGTMGDVDQEREREMWRTWAPPRYERPDGRSHWEADHPGFRTSIRLAVALADLRDEDGNVLESTPVTVENMFLCDVQFLDVLYTATHDLVAEIPPFGRQPRCTLPCRCGQPYLPVR